MMFAATLRSRRHGKVRTSIHSWEATSSSIRSTADQVPATTGWLSRKTSRGGRVLSQPASRQAPGQQALGERGGRRDVVAAVGGGQHRQRQEDLVGCVSVHRGQPGAEVVEHLDHVEPRSPPPPSPATCCGPGRAVRCCRRGRAGRPHSSPSLLSSVVEHGKKGRERRVPASVPPTPEFRGGTRKGGARLRRSEGVPPKVEKSCGRTPCGVSPSCS